MSDRLHPDAGHEPATPGIILVTGATDYVGGRLLSALEERGERVRCLARRPEVLRPRVASTTEVITGDINDPGALNAVLEGVHSAFCLIHAMDARGDFARCDREGRRALRLRGERRGRPAHHPSGRARARARAR